jgi:hypothetical protein
MQPDNPEMRMKKILISVLLVFLGPAFAQESPACSDDANYQALDFWLGEWRVVDQAGEYQGDNRIESILGGCAVLEHWTGAGGSPGKSLFYVIGDQWRQVWVTPYAQVPGGIKEKREVLRLEDGGIRFQGEITTAKGESYLDRTTLRPLDQGRVHQLIEISTDDGLNWKASFDAVYLPADG